jgi:hypothetical protein
VLDTHDSFWSTPSPPTDHFHQLHGGHGQLAHAETSLIGKPLTDGNNLVSFEPYFLDQLCNMRKPCPHVSGQSFHLHIHCLAEGLDGLLHMQYTTKDIINEAFMRVSGRRTTSADAEPFDGSAQVLFSQVRIPGAHLDRLVPRKLLDDLQVLAAHRQPRAKRVAVVVPAIPRNFRLYERRRKPASRIADLEHWADRGCRGGPHLPKGDKRLNNIAVHRDRAR